MVWATLAIALLAITNLEMGASSSLNNSAFSIQTIKNTAGDAAPLLKIRRHRRNI